MGQPYDATRIGMVYIKPRVSEVISGVRGVNTIGAIPPSVWAHQGCPSQGHCQAKSSGDVDGFVGGF